jgi:hypothetical protein
MFDGGTVRKPTGQGNHKLARELESKERIRLAKERDERRAAKERLNARTPLEIPRKGLYGRPRQRSSHIGHSTLKKQHARALRLFLRYTHRPSSIQRTTEFLEALGAMAGHTRADAHLSQSEAVGVSTNVPPGYMVSAAGLEPATHALKGSPT